MKNNQSIVQQAMGTSKTLVSTMKETPVISAMELEFVASKQRLESFFSDSVHLLTTMRGKAPSGNLRSAGTKSEIRLVKRVDGKAAQERAQWRMSLNVEEPFVDFQSSDNGLGSVAWDSPRTYVASSLENDLKYRIGIQEFYMDRVKIRVKWYFNPESVKYVRARETFLRLNYLPLRLVKRLVK